MAEDAGAAASEASEWGSREHEERLAALGEEEERFGGGGGVGGLSFIHSLIFLPYFLISFSSDTFDERLRLDGSRVAPSSCIHRSS